MLGLKLVKGATGHGNAFRIIEWPFVRGIDQRWSPLTKSQKNIINVDVLLPVTVRQSDGLVQDCCIASALGLRTQDSGMIYST